MSNGETESNDTGVGKDFGARLANASVCYCFLNWIAPLANPLVPGPGFPTVTTSTFGWTETETESGDEYWNALILMKFYDANTNQVLLVVPQIIPLAHNSYTRSRSRTLSFRLSLWPFGWPPWPAWPVPTRGAVNTGSQALAAGSLAECNPCP
jgi:hypothetical protein